MSFWRVFYHYLIMRRKYHKETNVLSKSREGGLSYMTTSPHTQSKHVLPTQGKIYRARGFLCTFKLLASDTNGAFTLSEAINAPNTGVPPHIQHLEDEAFIVLEGSYTFQVGDQTL